MTSESAKLHERIVAMTKDLQERDREIAGLKSAQLQYEEEVVGDLNEKNIALARENAQLRSDVMFLQERRKQLEDIVASLKINGGEHWFTYAYQRCWSASDEPQKWVNHCKECNKPEDDPSHFGNGVKALSSKDVEASVKAAHDRIASFLHGMHIGAVPARQMAHELLAGLPGMPE